MWQIAVKPDKPQAFFISLPSNPMFSFVTFLLFVRPFILRLQGVKCGGSRLCDYVMRADFTWPKANHRKEFLRVKINAQGGRSTCFSIRDRICMLTSTVWGDGLIDNPPRQTIARGDTVRFISFSDLIA